MVMPKSDTCHMKSRLISAARDLESANTLQKLKTSLRTQQRLWTSLPHHSCPACQKSSEITKFADFVLNVLQSHVFPDDRSISELVNINRRASRLLTELCPYSKQLPYVGTHARNFASTFDGEHASIL
jgi:hypothetical protein